MIELSPQGAIVIYLLLTLGVVLGIWVDHHYRARRRRVTPETKVYMCEYCHYAYEAGSATKVTRCPQCQAFNERG